MISAAGIANCFKRNGGMLYIVPRNNPSKYRTVMSAPKFLLVIVVPIAARLITRNQAVSVERFFAAIGR